MLGEVPLLLIVFLRLAERASVSGSTASTTAYLYRLRPVKVKPGLGDLLCKLCHNVGERG